MAGHYTDGFTLQQDTTAWIWNQIWDGGGARNLSEPLNTPNWSEFDVTLPDGTVATVNVKVKP